jgi:hypothetical protein
VETSDFLESAENLNADYVLVVDDHEAVRNAIQRDLSSDPEVETVAVTVLAQRRFNPSDKTLRRRHAVAVKWCNRRTR